SQRIESVFPAAGKGEPTALAYDPVVNEILVVDKSGWLLELNPSTGAVQGNISLPGGPGAVSFDPLSGNAFVAENDSGAVSILAPSLPPPPVPLGFTETGLPPGTSWSVSVDDQTRSTSGSSAKFNVTVGTHYFYVGYIFNWTSKPLDQGFVTVGSAPRTISLTFRNLGLYPVRFVESGLPGGTEWNMTFNGSFAFTLGATMQFYAPNGSYAFTISSPPSYIAFPASGNLSVIGAPVVRPIRFESLAELRYPVVFFAGGIPAGTAWAIEVNGSHFATTSFSISFSLWNGSYNFLVDPVRNFTAEPASGSLKVAGGGLAVNVTFSPRGTPGSGSSGWLSLLSQPVFIGLIPTAVAGATVFAVWHSVSKRRKSPPKGSRPPTEPPPPREELA
ncbi:MAG TPA: hypothetical protein VJS68_02935, partial [Thermoplasmata archaeon]|nr:hypothetical protein [Thermoplasmata archaeon]